MGPSLGGNALRNLFYAIVKGRGGKSDPVQDGLQTGLMQAVVLGLQTDGDVPLSIRNSNPTGLDQCTFAGQVDHGTVVGVEKTSGHSDLNVIGLPGSVNRREGQPGNLNLMSGFSGLSSQKSGRKRPPDYEEKKERGALIRKIKEKGDWTFGLTEGIAEHAAFAQIAGNFLPQIKSIPTALKEHSQIPTAEMLGQLKSVVMNIGQMLGKIQSNPTHMATVSQKMPREIITAFNSIAALTQGSTAANLGYSVTGNRVNEEVFLDNAVNLLKDCKTTADILDTLGRLHSDTTLHGLDELEDLEFVHEGPWGNTTIKMNHSGEVKEEVSNTVNNAINAFSSAMSSASSSPSASPGTNLFGQSAEIMKKMATQLPKEAQKKFKEMMEKLNEKDDAIPTHDKRTKKVKEAKKPLEEDFA